MFVQDQTLPFHPQFGVPMTFYWIVLFIVCILLISSKSLSKRVRITIFTISLLLGIIYGGLPNPVMPIQQTLIALGLHQELLFLLPAWTILSIVLITSFLVGRVFCGYTCPLGTLQELLSIINFKSDIKSQKNTKLRIEVQTKYTTKIRWIFLALLFVLAIGFNLILIREINPFTGFFDLRNLGTFTITLPLIILILLSIASIFLYRPWCRFFCPFGAGSAFLGRFTRDKYIRTEACTDCKLCERICPTQEAFVDSRKGECYYCNRCIDICPHNAIQFSLE